MVDFILVLNKLHDIKKLKVKNSSNYFILPEHRDIYFSYVTE